VVGVVVRYPDEGYAEEQLVEPDLVSAAVLEELRRASCKQMFVSQSQRQH
jgi:hypothetical protein